VEDLKRKNRNQKDEVYPVPKKAKTLPPPKPKKKGRTRGATSYTFGDITAILDAVEEVLPTQLSNWDNVEEHYNRYAARFYRKDRKTTELRTKYWELAWGEPSGGGERNDFEKRAKEIEGMINQKGGVVLVGDDDERNFGPCSSSSSSSERITRSTTLMSTTRQPQSSQLRFEKMISQHLKDEAARSDERHKEKMDLFSKLLDKF
jgi:hypothetical protein